MSSKKDMFEMIEWAELYFMRQDVPPSKDTVNMAKKWVKWLDKKRVAWFGATSEDVEDGTGIQILFEYGGKRYEMMFYDGEVYSLVLVWKDKEYKNISESEAREVIEKEIGENTQVSFTRRKEGELLYEEMKRSGKKELKDLAIMGSDSYTGRFIQYGEVIDIVRKNDDYTLIMNIEIEMGDSSLWVTSRVSVKEVKKLLDRDERE